MMRAQDVIKENGHPYFVALLQAEPADGADEGPSDTPAAVTDGAGGGDGAAAGSPSSSDAPSLTTLSQAVFVLAMLCHGSPAGQQRCFEARLLQALMRHAGQQFAATQARAAGGGINWRVAVAPNLLLLKWCLLGLGAQCADFPAAVCQAVDELGVFDLLQARGRADAPPPLTRPGLSGAGVIGSRPRRGRDAGSPGCCCPHFRTCAARAAFRSRDRTSLCIGRGC